MGSQIDFIRLIVHDVAIEPYTSPDGSHLEGIRWNVESTYEIWGRPIPEPGSLPLVVLGCASYSLRRKMQHRC
ncbi:MAG: PEP-CTERM sorting domain-containing protein [Phycisphaerales bacterium]|nr:PEP-CTERM sorting domain-containing protein [Phycisphaerales bacterium]